MAWTIIPDPAQRSSDALKASVITGNLVPAREMRPDGLPPMLSDRGHAPTRTNSSCCLGEVRDGVTGLCCEPGGLGYGTTDRRNHRRSSAGDDGAVAIGVRA